MGLITPSLFASSRVMDSGWQIIELFVLGIPIASIARTVVSEEIFKEPREWCKNRSETSRNLIQRKFFYLFTCEYCFSHYVTALFLFITRYKLLYDDWRGYIISFFSLVFVANIYLNIFARLRVDLHREKAIIKSIETSTTGKDNQSPSTSSTTGPENP